VLLRLELPITSIFRMQARGVDVTMASGTIERDNTLVLLGAHSLIMEMVENIV
jgi:hypothetical protein